MLHSVLVTTDTPVGGAGSAKHKTVLHVHSTVLVITYMHTVQYICIAIGMISRANYSGTFILCIHEKIMSVSVDDAIPML